jgi:hypothetical protein
VCDRCRRESASIATADPRLLQNGKPDAGLRHSTPSTAAAFEKTTIRHIRKFRKPTPQANTDAAAATP